MHFSLRDGGQIETSPQQGFYNKTTWFINTHRGATVLEKSAAAYRGPQGLRVNSMLLDWQDFNIKQKENTNKKTI